MPILLFSLRGVPEDEAAEVRELLNHHQIDFYETPPGNWGVSMPAIWLTTAQQLQQAQQLLSVYQQQRQISQRELYLQRKRTGQHKTLIMSFKEKPLLMISYIFVMTLTLYASVKLVVELGLAIF